MFESYKQTCFLLYLKVSRKYMYTVLLKMFQIHKKIVSNLYKRVSVKSWYTYKV